MKINKPVATIILAVIDVILLLLFVFPKYRESEGLQAVLAKTNSDYDNQLNYNQKLSEDLKNLQSNNLVLEKVNSALPQDTSFAPIVYFLQQKTNENGLTILSITFSKNLQEQSDSAGQLKNVLFTINMSGSYQGFKNFLYAIENSDRLFEVSDISFSLSQPEPGHVAKQNQPNDYNFRLGIKTYGYSANP